jgi:hypothetical protein
MHLKPTATLSYAQLDTNLHNLNQLLKATHEFEPESEKYKQWKDSEIDFLTDQYISTQRLIDAKLALIPVEVLLAAIDDTTIAIEMPEKF